MAPWGELYYSTFMARQPLAIEGADIDLKAHARPVRPCDGRVGCILALALGLLASVTILSAVTLSEVIDDDSTGSLSASAAATQISVPACPTTDTIVPDLPLSVLGELRQVYTASYPDVPGSFRLQGFHFVDPDNGLIDATMVFDVPNVVAGWGIPSAAAWCNTAGAQTFRISFAGTCLFDSDQHFNYYHVIARTGLGEDCLLQQPGNCRLIKVSKPGAGFNEWTESEDGSPTGGAIETLHDGLSVGVKLKWSLCPTSFASISVNATW